MAGVAPSDDELVEFARSTLGGLADRLVESDALRQTVVEARAFWRQLYEVSRSKGSSSGGDAIAAEPTP